jgi:hypothetical protein
MKYELYNNSIIFREIRIPEIPLPITVITYKHGNYVTLIMDIPQVIGIGMRLKNSINTLKKSYENIMIVKDILKSNNNLNFNQ